MSGMDDSSLISGISNLSRISKTNSSTHYKFDSTCNISEWRSMCRDVNKSFTNDSQRTELRKVSELKKVNKALNSCEESTCDYAKLKLIYECLKEIIISSNSLIENNLISKLKELIRIHEIKKFLYLPNNSKELKEELTLLGIIDLPNCEFNYEEQLAIKSCLETKIRERIHRFITIYANFAGSSKDILKNNESILCSRFQLKTELENIHWKDKIDEVYLEYKRDSLHCLKILNQWNELKWKMNEKNTKDIENLLLKSEIAEMKAIITKLSCTIRMYTETPSTVDAFKILNLNLEEKINTVNEEIVKKTELRKSYEVLSNTEYDEILRKYLNLCHIVKKKKTLLDNL
ncbi:PREDICTED: uncharacterized protein LOC105359740 [Ceratosolen solmsi marchali]|uniref:Uncharacterized protein LOC105359740 n=1 Tax=Ceratosolen solmsi marchali TaxID=326594 RepID=A0AAJ6YBU0_9HYME|nr:PREDICTED: uncharacterized protein LOC105359740 [Ceratosolen solmsi marchali]